MSPKAKTYLILLLCLNISHITMLGNLENTNKTIGVNSGDIFYYEMFGHFESDDPNFLSKIPPFEKNNTKWLKIEITKKTNNTIYHTYTLQFNNGSKQEIKARTSLINSSDQSQDFIGIPIIPANLTKGDLLPTLPLKINNTLQWSYPEESREVNLVQWLTSDDFGYCYFDKKTGMLLSLNRTHIYINPKTNHTIRKTDIIKMTKSNVWNIQPQNPLPIISILIVSSILLLYYFTKKFTKNKNVSLKQ